MTSTLKTPFGTFLGIKGGGVIQYRGIKYAYVKDQLSSSELVTSYPEHDIIDATHFGSVPLSLPTILLTPLPAQPPRPRHRRLPLRPNNPHPMPPRRARRVTWDVWHAVSQYEHYGPRHHRWYGQESTCHGVHTWRRIHYGRELLAAE